MNKNQIENKISSSFSAETPDLLSRIMESCDKEDEARDILSEKIVIGKKRKAPVYAKLATMVASLLVMFIVGALVGRTVNIGIGDNGGNDGGNEGEESGYVASVFIDVNPSVNLTVSEDGKVVDCVAGNADAEKIVSDMVLKGTDVRTALNAIIGSMYMHGYLVESTNSMLVSVDSNGGSFDGLLDNIVENVNDIVRKTGIFCSIVAQNISSDEELRRLAEENSVSYGKMSLINKIIEGTEDYSEEDIQGLTTVGIKELNILYGMIKEKDSDENGDHTTPDSSDKDETEGGSSRPDSPVPGPFPDFPETDNDQSDSSEVQRPGDGNSVKPGKTDKEDIISGVLDRVYNDKEKALALALAYLSDKLGAEIGAQDISDGKVKAEYVTVRDGKRFELLLIYNVEFDYNGELYGLSVNLADDSVEERSDKNGDGNHTNKPDEVPEESEDRNHRFGESREDESEGDAVIPPDHTNSAQSGDIEEDVGGYHDANGSDEEPVGKDNAPPAHSVP